MTGDEYDIVIVGAGIAGALIADRLARSGLHVLILEAGPSLSDRQTHINKFYRAAAKVPGAPWPRNLDGAPSPGVLDLVSPDWQDGSKYYLHQKGPLPFSSTWERVAGGTVNHWQGISLRHVPNDFRVASTYGPAGAQDWPVTYEDLEEWYCQAEHLIGVSGDHDAWNGVLGAFRSREYPMPPIPHSYQDKVLQKRLKGALIEGREIHVLPVPQARNSVGRDGRPPCMGNTSCIPICPIQAKYDAAITLERATQIPGTPAKLRHRSVAYRVEVDRTGQVHGIRYKKWDGTSHVARGRRYVLAANAVETAKLLLMSPWRSWKSKNLMVGNRSDQVGRNLMDHVIHLGWALVDEPVDSFRGPISTGTIEAFRDGAHRKDHSAFVLAVSNTGWGWAANSPFNLVNQLVKKGLRGKKLRRKVADHLSRQISITAEMEQMPSSENRVLPSKKYSDPRIGIPKPEIHYDLSSYELAGFVAAKRTLSQVFSTLGREFTTTGGGSGLFMANGQRFNLRGAGHVMGTTRMGDDPENSVVDPELRCHDHENLFVVGGSVFPMAGTANPTLTIAALALRAAETLARDLGSESPSVY